MSLGSFVKNIQNIMRGDSGINGDAQRIEQMTWLLFLKVYDSKESEWEFNNNDGTYQSIIPTEYRWQNWATDNKDGKAPTGQELLDFVNAGLFPTLRELPITPETPMNQVVVQRVFEDANNFMKDGVLLRQVINVIDEIEFDGYKDRHAFGEIYETILKSLQSAGNAGEFYTPRAVTDFTVKMLDPKLGETAADFACGTGGFLTSVLKHLEPTVKTPEDIKDYKNSIYGIEKKPLPYLLAVTNMLLHDIDRPQIYHDNALELNVREYKSSDLFDIVIMNPPYGGTESEITKTNFPTDLRSSETADLFMSVAMYRLKTLALGGGRAAMIIPDGFLFGTDGAKTAIKAKLIEEFNLHTIIRLPTSVFAPYTSITTNILFFDNSKKTDKIWFYRLDKPENQKHFSKTRPMKLEHFDDAVAWWHDRKEIKDTETDTYKAKAFMPDEIKSEVIDLKTVTDKKGNETIVKETKVSYNLDLCGYPTVEEEVLSPEDTIRQFHDKREELNRRIDKQLLNIASLIGLDLQKADLVAPAQTDTTATKAQQYQSSQ